MEYNFKELYKVVFKKKKNSLLKMSAASKIGFS